MSTTIKQPKITLVGAGPGDIELITLKGLKAIQSADVILYDEPTAGLDPIVSYSINKLIRHLQRELHVTSIVVTHDMVSCYHIADRVALLNEGRIYFLGNQQELRDSTDPIIRDFVDGRSGETIY
jgi:phospholipid/cholesterol/gamma-HCH transport system ATP-binding protein